ncbi:uncharacterized protein LOC126847908 isoform X5 [Adelges cooleyi]|uniref:uncharacterized protein LOC126847908 isoform X5 n=1 Tax=Adelges cooleyi TaxID=133065 RepID=UPI00217FE777|nr:uncharacterized protein LOC126847908 isoform X5 [Adelges cooleyi]
MVKLSHMFGAPALAMPLLVPSLIDERVANYEEILQELKDSQIKLQTEITNLLGVSVPERGLLNTVMRSLGWTRDSTGKKRPNSWSYKSIYQSCIKTGP